MQCSCCLKHEPQITFSKRQVKLAESKPPVCTACNGLLENASTAEEKLKKDSEPLNTFEKRVMGGENCDISPKDMVQYLGQSVEATRTQFNEETPKFG